MADFIHNVNCKKADAHVYTHMRISANKGALFFPYTSLVEIWNHMQNKSFGSVKARFT